MMKTIKKGDIDRLIWGHRLYDEQTGIMTLLEFLSVLESKTFAQHNPNREISSETLKLGDYKIPKRTVLRTLVFNNPYIDEIYTSREDPWERWFNCFSADDQNAKFDSNGSYKAVELKEKLQNLFGDRSDRSGRKSFDNFARIIRLLRFSGINVMSDKRWTSRFIFPWGKNCLFGDLRQNGTTDRRFFGRNGELLFLLLSFAQRRDELERLIRERILESNHPLDRLCEALQIDNEVIQIPGGALLPEFFNVEDFKRVDILCEDLIHLFELPIPTPDVVNFATRIIQLNLLCFFMECSFKVLQSCGTEMPFEKNIYICEVIQKTSTDLRRISKEIFVRNNKQSADAVRAYYERELGEQRGTDDEEFELQLMEGESMEGKADTLEQVLSTHSEHWGKIHRAFSKDCGLSSRLCTNAFRYAPMDELLEALAAAIVTSKRLLLSQFLAQVYERYGLIFGEAEFKRAGVSVPNLVADSSEFKKNRRRLQGRFEALGLLVTLSDGFEFVLNPYRS